ncbi:apolipoprotein Eb-like [Stegostoma tigrinum]|uniref:apolipoprotein Eb-like n=1 Tax=Stegostoma tigrinum TaxID=3053191 RepID=UPI00202B1A59|nr:apolipoprotein Eb-like [Stegostoma tigrinum]XP_059497220.1 apolipoprotein Eb-like [Stegostoma tigrinum]XP_059497221.1 apolipoprotein Eb-like [Stegostoma tigrinum]
MKTSVTLVAVLLILGSQAEPQDEAFPRSKWEEAIEKFWSFTTDLAQSTQGLLKQIQTAELDKHLETLIAECMTELNASGAGLQAQLGPYSERFNSDMEELSNRLHSDLMAIRSNLLVYQEEAKLMVKQNVEDVRQTLALYLRKYRKRLNRDQASIRAKLHEYAEELRSRRDRTLDDLKAMAAPYSNAAESKVLQHVQNIQQSLAQQAEDVRLKAEALQEHVSSNADDIREALQVKMEQIGAWFRKEAQTISQRFSEFIDYLHQKMNPSQSPEEGPEEPSSLRLS